MRKLVVSTFVTLDGVMQAPGGPDEDPAGGFSHGGWTVPYFDEKVGKFMDELMGKPFDLVLGRKTYEIFASYWPTSQEDGAKELNDAAKYVASRTLQKVDWANSTLLRGDVVQEIRKLKQQDGRELQVHGSQNLLQTLLKHNVIDEMRVLIFPVTVGSGKRLFGEGTVPAGFKLVDCKTSDSGAIMAVYAAAGELKTGTFG